MITSVPTATSRPASLDAVLGYAWTAQEFTATEAMDATGLTRSTTIDAMETLTEMGILRELPNARLAGQYRKGRPARRFTIDAEAAILVGVHADEAHATVIVTDLRGDTLRTHRVIFDLETEDQAHRAAVIVDAVDDALALAERDRSEVLSICVGVPAPVNAEGRSPTHRKGFWARMNPELIDAFAWAPIAHVDNDASLAAIAEGSEGGAAGCRDYVALLAGQRFGAGVVVDGHLLRGYHGGVGEMVAFDHVEGVGSAEGITHRVALLALDAIDAREIAPDSPLAQLPRPEVTGRTVLELAASGDPGALVVAERAGVLLARVVSVLGSMFDPERVVISGSLSAGLDHVVSAARRALPTDLDLPAPELVASPLGNDVVAMGAVAAAVEAARRHVLDVWPALALA